MKPGPTPAALPPYLVAQAQARANAAAARIASHTPPTIATGQPAPARAATSPIQPLPPPARATRRTPPTQPPAPVTSPQAAPAPRQRGGNPSGEADPFEADWGPLADRIVEESGDQAAARLLRGHLPAILEALAEGAKKPGSVGAADRAMLLRLIRHSSSTAKEQAQAARQLGAALGSKLAEAMARRDAAVGRVVEGSAEPI